nr:recombinase family protein [Ruthenibacterium lactatiformans]
MTYKEDRAVKYTNQFGESVQISASDEIWLNDEFFASEMAKLPPDAPRAGLAYRVSTKGQVDHDDIPMQKIECRKFCAQHGWRVVLEKAEKGVSGSKISATKRDAIQELKAEAEKGNIDILLVFLFDRLGRIESETPYVVEWFVKHGVEVWSTREGQQKIDSHTDKLINYIRFWQAAGESEKIAERVATRIQQLNSSGHYSGGTVAYGYRAVHKGRVNKKGQPVKDLEVAPEEAAIVQELFELAAFEGKSAYAMAEMLNNRGLRTHSGAKFTPVHVLRILRHEGYLGYIVTRSVKSQHLPELEIISPELFQKANEMVDMRCTSNAEARKVAHKSDNNTLLAGLVYCAHCGAKMSGFMHHDRYKLRDGTVKESLKPKYNCYQRAQKLRDCDGQALYLADRVDGIVLEVVRELFSYIRCAPRDKLLEQKIRQEYQDKRKQKAAMEKRLQDCEHALERYEAEVLRCLDGESGFSQEMLARLIAKAEAELRAARQEYAKVLQEAEDDRELAQKIKECYRQFCGWAEEFELAPLARKRMILSELLEKVEVGKGYQVTVHVKLTYKQFLELCQTEETSEISLRNATDENVA